MAGRSRRVSVQRLADRTGKAYAANKPFVVKWTVDGHPKSKAWPTEKAGDRFRSQLVAAADRNEWFDIESGLPESLLTKAPAPGLAAGPTFVEHASAHVRRKWPNWKGNSRRSAVEALVIAACTLTDTTVPNDMVEQMRFYLSHVALNPMWGVVANGDEPPTLSRPSERCRCRT